MAGDTILGPMALSSRSRFGTEPNRLSRLRAEKLGAGERLIDLSASNPTVLGLCHDPGLFGGAFLSADNLRYDPQPRGLSAAREEVSAATGADPDSLYLCASTSEAYGWLFKLLCDPGEAVLVPRPGYPLFDHLAALEGVEAIGYPLEYFHPSGWSMDLDRLGDLLSSSKGERIKALVLINPNNPTGSYLRPDERSALLELCARRGLALVVDEVFFGFPLEPRPGIASFLGESGVLCFVLDGLSKRLCLPQVKLGWIAISGPAREAQEAKARLDVIADAYLSAGTPVMNALPALLALGDEMRARVIRRMESNLRSYREILEGADSPHRVLRCEGGWTALVESPSFLPEEDIALRLLDEEGIFVQPGYFFDMEREPRFAFSLIQDEETAREGARRYRSLFDRLSLS